MTTATIAHEASSCDSQDAHLSQVANIISTATKWSAAAGVIPVPVLDITALAAVQTRMLMDISEVYGQRFGKEAATAFVSVSLGSLLPGVAAGAVIGSSMKMGVGVGSVLGMLTMSAAGAAATYAVGKVFARHLHTGGAALDLSPDAIKADLKAEFDSAKSKQAK